MGIPLPAKNSLHIETGPRSQSDKSVFLYEAQTVSVKVGEYHSLADIPWLFQLEISSYQHGNCH